MPGVRSRASAIWIGYITLLCANPVVAEELIPNPDKAYLVFNISVKPSRQPQPTWLAVNRATQGDYIPIGESIVELTPGIYRFHHLDFGDDYRKSHHSVDFAQDYKLKLTPGTIAYLGWLEVRGIHRSYEQNSRITRHIRIKRLDTTELFRKACLKAPDVFESFQMYGPGDKEMDNPCKEPNEH